MSLDRYSEAAERELITDPDEKARREAENGVRQFIRAAEIIRTHVQDSERPFRLRSSTILDLNSRALDGIHRLAGTYRNTPVAIQGSGHQPPDAFLVAEEVEGLCDYVNSQWADLSAIHLAAYTLWRLNWIHPFADGNGRTARAVSYVTLNIKLNSLLPGAQTIPDQIASDKTPYYEALEAADEVWRTENRVDVSVMEEMLSSMLAKQLLAAVHEAGGSLP